MSLALSYLVFLYHSKQLWLNASIESQSLLSLVGKSSQTSGIYQSLIVKLGTMIANILPEKAIRQLEFEYFNLDRTKDQLLETIAQAFISFIVFLALYLFSYNLIFLLLSFLIPAVLILEINLASFQFKREIESSVEQLVRCLKVLVIKSETPIINALEIIMQDLPLEYKAVRRELAKLVNKAAKSGLRTTLLEWQTDLPKFRDFIALLISINDGASKHALKLSFDNFLKKIEENKANEIKDQAENVQLYLMGPVVVMLIVVSLPMVDAIRFLMMSAMQIGE